MQANHLQLRVDFAAIAGNIAAGVASKMAKWRRAQPNSVSYFEASGLGCDAGGILDFSAGLPVHRNESRDLLDPPQPRPDRGKCHEVVIAAVGDMGVAIERNIGDCQLARGKI